MLVGDDVHSQHSHEHTASVGDALLAREDGNEGGVGVDIGHQATRERHRVKGHSLRGCLVSARYLR